MRTRYLGDLPSAYRHARRTPTAESLPWPFAIIATLHFERRANLDCITNQTWRVVRIHRSRGAARLVTDEVSPTNAKLALHVS
jgi:hypothetical protein